MMKRMKDMRDMVNAAPGVVAQGQQMAAQAVRHTVRCQSPPARLSGPRR